MRQTSLMAFKKLKARITRLEMDVYAAIAELGGAATDWELADYLGWTINRITGRRNGLEKKFIVYADGTITNKETGQKNTVWRINPDVDIRG